MNRVQAQAAATAPASVPDGLAVGGLQVATGANAGWTNAQAPTQTSANGHTTVTITQTAQTANLNWNTFNVGKNTTLDFDQSKGGNAAGSWEAINRVYDPSAQPSIILGQINAQGQVYVINANGIIFGAGSQVNTAALIASSAALSQSQFNSNGIYSTTSNGDYVPSFTNAGGAVVVQAGAQITTNAPLTAVQDGGYVMLLGSTVSNAGQITTPAGQTILAAGKDFILRPGYAPSSTTASTALNQNVSTTLGTEVAIAESTAPNGNNPAVSEGGAVTNTGLIQATTGDVTMVGAKVTQAGVILATTSTAQRGTIHLLTDVFDPTTSVTLAPGSVTYIAPDSSTVTASNATRSDDITASVTENQTATTYNSGLTSQTLLLNDEVRGTQPDQQYQSRVEISTGGVVDFQPNSLTVANGGQIAVSAETLNAEGSASGAGRLEVETGAIIDVSGLLGVTLSASADALAVSVEPFELRDAPVNRVTNNLNSSNVYVDVPQLIEVTASPGSGQPNRYYTPGGLLEVSGELNNVQHGITEWMTLGGSVNLAAGSVVAQPGAVINIAGGSVQYQAGYVPQTWLVGSDGRLYNINTAPATLTYTGVFNGFTTAHPRWNVSQTWTVPLIATAQYWQPGYTVGRDAGSLVINAPTTVFEATLDAGVVNGQFQNTAPGPGVVNSPFITKASNDPFLLPQSAVPLGGSLFTGLYFDDAFFGPTTNTLTVGDIPPVAASIPAGTPIAGDRVGTTDFSAAALSSSGLAALSLTANSSIVIGAPLQLAPGGQASLLAVTTTITGSITSPGGSVSVTDLYTQGSSTTVQPLPPTTPDSTPGITLGAGASIDTEGLWTNLVLDPASQNSLAFQNGGSVSLDTSGALTLAPGSVINASAGGAVLANGKTEGGKGGDITLVANDPNGGQPLSPLTLGGRLLSYGVTQGGSLTLQAPGILIGAMAPADLPNGQLWLSPDFFRQGFSSYTIDGYGTATDASGHALPGVEVQAGTAVSVVEPVYEFNARSQLVPTGSAASTAMTVALPSLYFADPATGVLTQRAGASLTLRSLTNSAGGSIDVGDGASITVDPSRPDQNATNSITLDAWGSIVVNGTLTAPSGNISLLNEQQTIPIDQSYAYLLGLSIWLGSDSRLDVAAQPATAVDQYGRPFGWVEPGGSIVIGNTLADVQANKSLTGAFVFVRPGAVLDGSGGAAIIDPAAGLRPADPYAAGLGGPREVASAGGTISFSSSEGIYLDGTMLAPSGGPTAAGGTLDVALASPVYVIPQDPRTHQPYKPIPASLIPDAMRVPRYIVISQDAVATTLPASLQPGATSFAATPGFNLGQTQLSAAQVSSGGFANLSLVADTVAFNGDVNLTTSQSIHLTAGAIADTQPSGQVALTSPYVLLQGGDGLLAGLSQFDTPTTVLSLLSLGQFYNFSQSQPALANLAFCTPACTTASLTVSAGLIDLQDTLVFGVHYGAVSTSTGAAEPTVDLPGFNQLTLNSSGDIRFLAPSQGEAATVLLSQGSIALNAAQVYPAGGTQAAVVAGYDELGHDYYPDATLSIGSSGARPQPPLSAFGDLYLFGPTINQGGDLQVPNGFLQLGGPASGQWTGQIFPFQFSGSGANTQTEAVNLLPGSVTSVSMAGLNIPYGGTTDGVTWTYNGGSNVEQQQIGAPGLTTAGVEFNAQSVSVEGGAVVDLSGGGELTGTGFITGQGGSTDTLTTPLLSLASAQPGSSIATPQQSTTGTQIYAIIAGPQLGYAPKTVVDQSGASGIAGDSTASLQPQVGEQITIPAGVPGLPAGTYTLYPSYYALLPGGYRVQFTQGSTPSQIPGTLTLPTGSYLAAGIIGTAGTGFHTTLPTEFTITPASEVQVYSQYDTESFSQFAQAQATTNGTSRLLLPQDAKALSLVYPTATADLPTLSVAGTVLTQAASGGYGSWLFVEAPGATVEVTAAGDTPTPGTQSAPVVSVAASQLNALNAESVVIGGTIRGATSSTGGTLTFSDASNGVVMQSGAVLSAPQVFLASNSITMEPGSGINTLGNGAIPADYTQVYTYQTGNAAVVGAANGAITFPQGASGSGSIDVGGCFGIDVCGSNPVQLYSNGALAILTQGTVALNANVAYGARYIDIGVANVNIGTAAALAQASAPTGLLLTPDIFASLLAGDPATGAPALQSLTLQASNAINFYGSVDFSTINATTGQSSLQQLVLQTPAVYGYGAPGDVATITTDTLVWNGLLSGHASATPPQPTANGPGTGSGTLNVIANQIVLGYPPQAATPQLLPSSTQSIALNRQTLGFATVNLTGNSQIEVADNGSLAVFQTQTGTTDVGGTLNLITPLLTGQAGATVSITAGDAINVQAPAGIAPSSTTQGALGATLNLTAASITDSSAIVLPSGSLSMTATGSIAGSDDVTLAAGSRTVLSGQATQYVDQTSYSWGGNVALESTSGNVVQDAGALIDVSATNNNAGSIAATAMNGAVQLNGTINGGANDGYSAGALTIRTGTMSQDDFDSLNGRLNAGSVFGIRSFDIGSVAGGLLTIGNDPGGNPLLHAHNVSVSVDQGDLEVSGTIDASGAAPGTISLAAGSFLQNGTVTGGNLTVDGGAVLDAHGTALQADSQGNAIPSENVGTVNLTVSGNFQSNGTAYLNQGTGTLTLGGGATIDVGGADGPLGQVNLNAPRTAETSGAVRISAPHAVNIQGAGTVAVNGFWTYSPTDANGTVEQDNGGGTGGPAVNANGVVGLNQINTISTSFIDNAPANPANLAGLGAYHLRPGVEIDSSSQSGGNLTVSGDLNLAGFRYGPNAVTDPGAANYGAGEPGVLLLRASDNLNIDGSINDGFGTPPATPDDAGWVVKNDATTTSAITIQGGGSPLLQINGLSATTFGGSDSLNTQVSLPTGTALIPGTTLPSNVTVTLSTAIPLLQSFTLTSGTLTEPNGTKFTAGQTITRSPRGTTIPAGTTLSLGFTLPPGSVVSTWRINAYTWPAGASLASVVANVSLPAGTVIPTGSFIVTQSGQPFSYETGNIWAVAPMLAPGSQSWSMQFVAGADLAAADTGTLQAASALQAQASAVDPTPGSITLKDPHFQNPLNPAVSNNPVPSVIRTGTGSLQFLTGGDFTELSSYGIYTAGSQTPGIAGTTYDQPPPALPSTGTFAAYSAVESDYQAYYPTGGGNLTLAAQGAITVDPIAANGITGVVAGTAVGSWLWRQAGTDASGNPIPTAWWINFGSYVPSYNLITGANVVFEGFSGIGTLGGGNASVSAGGNVSGLNLAVGSTGRVTDPASNTYPQTGGGALTLTAGGAVQGGVLTDTLGDLTVQAGSIPAGPDVVIGDGSASLSTLGDLAVTGVGDPTRVQQEQFAQELAFGSVPAQASWFSLWQMPATTGQSPAATTVSLFSAGGNVQPIVPGSDPNIVLADNRFVYPPVLDVTASSGDILLNRPSQGSTGQVYSALELAPSAQGQARFLAAGSIIDQSIGSTATGGQSIQIPLTIDISGANPDLLPTPLNPAYSGSPSLDQTAHPVANALFAFAPDTITTDLHAGDPGPALFYAATGDIVGLNVGEDLQTAQAGTWYIAAKATRIMAGLDIIGLGFPSYSAIGTNAASGQPTYQMAPEGGNDLGSVIFNANPNDVSEIIAGRDIKQANVRVLGPGAIPGAAATSGSLYVQAGRNIDQQMVAIVNPTSTLDESFVIDSSVVRPSSGTQSGGPGITVLAGAGSDGPDWSGFASLYLDPANLADPKTPLQEQSGKVERTYQSQLLTWLRQNFGYAGSAGGALAYFQTLPVAEQQQFLLTVYFAELNQSGLDYNDPTSRFFHSYLEGNEAIQALFPANFANPQQDTGDLTLTGGSGITTLYGGNVTLLAPGGAATLGVLANNVPATAGVLTQGNGNISIYSQGSVLLGQSRIFTTYGGNIIVWSSHGDINAGAGAKTTVVAAPRAIAYQANGAIFLSPTVPSTGAGIATLAPIASVPPGDINLVAPLGVIDAGEAGIRSSGNANLAALTVLNAANIQVQGKTSGLPVITLPNLSAAAAGNAAAGAAEQAAQQLSANPQQNTIPSIFIVRVLGFGGSDQDSQALNNRRKGTE